MGDRPLVLPEDKYNDLLVQNVHPPDWVNPEPKDRYNLVVIGAGTAGLVTAAGAAGLGAKVALVEKHLMGGDCLNVGCVPSKGMIRASRVAAELKRASGFGITATDAVVDFPAVMERMRRLRSRISEHDSAKRFTELGVDVFIGRGEFTGPDTLEVDGATLRFKKAVIATGARAFVPPIEGLGEAGYLTNENAFELTGLPKRLFVIGGGPIGCELAQAFRRLGSSVTLLHLGEHILDREDPDAAAIVIRAFEREGIEMLLGGWQLERVESADGIKRLHLKKEGEMKTLEVDEVLVGAGRVPNTDGLGLEKAGVEFDKFGVKADKTLRTTNHNIYAAGDITLMYKFTHTADAAARIAIQNALFMGKKEFPYNTIPWCTYTDPEIAHVGMYEQDARKAGLEVDTFVRELGEVDRAVLDGEDEGFVKIHVKKGTDRILGATIVASHAGDMISTVSVAMSNGVGLKGIANTIFPYPTQAEAVKQVADMYSRTRLTPNVKKWVRRWLDLTR